VSADDLEAWLTRYFAASDATPGLTPQAFLAAHPDAPTALEAALATAAEVAGMLQGSNEARTRVGPYPVVRELGRGAMGVVYEVVRGDGPAAVKLLPPFGAASEHARARFAREAEALRRLDHPGLARVLEVGVDGSAPFLVLELVSGASLATLAAPLPFATAASLVADLAEAAAAAHARGVVHRDIKPANVLLRPGGHPVLIDFGLAALADDAGLTGTGDLLGTPRYMAPEQAAGERGDARSDVYALGLVLHELLAGRPARTETTREAALRAARRGQVEALRRVRRDVPKDLRAIVAKALAARPHRRYASAGALAADLRAFVAGQPVDPRPPGKVAAVVDALAASRALRRVVVAGAGVMLLAAGCWWLERTRARRWLVERADLALAAYLAGADEAARSVAEEGLRSGDEPLLRALTAALAPGPPPADQTLANALVRLRQRPAEAATLLAAAGVDAAASLCASMVRAELAAEQGAVGEAIAALDPKPGEERVAQLVRRLVQARIALAHGELATAVRAARAAADLGDREPRGLTGTLVDLLEGARDRPALRTALAQAASAAPGDAELRFALAYSFDVDHDIVGAAAEYRRVLQVAPDHPRALVCLAHLRSGAERDHCAACAKSFAEHPELVDQAEAGSLALRALAAAGTREVAVLDAGARVALTVGAAAELGAWLARAEAAGALGERLEWWRRRCERAGR